MKKGILRSEKETHTANAIPTGNAIPVMGTEIPTESATTTAKGILTETDGSHSAETATTDGSHSGTGAMATAVTETAEIPDTGTEAMENKGTQATEKGTMEAGTMETGTTEREAITTSAIPATEKGISENSAAAAMETGDSRAS